MLELIGAACKMHLATMPLVAAIGMATGGVGGAIALLANPLVAAFAGGVGIASRTVYYECIHA